MNKRLISLLLVTLLVLCVGVPAFAGSALVIDRVGVLTSEQKSQLTQKAQEVSDRYGIDTVILITDSFYGKNSAQFADDFYLSQDFRKNCSILLIAVEDRRYFLYNCGEASKAVTDYGSYYIDGEVLTFLSDNDWYGAASVYLDLNNDFYKEYYESGQAYDVNHKVVTAKDILLRIAICLGIGALITGIIVYSRSRALISVEPQTDASDYSYAFHLDFHNDHLIDKRVSVIPIPRQEPPRGGGFHGGGTTMHTGSSGHSFSGHGGRF